MRYDPQKHDRRSIRLKGYDYTQAGAYFVTVCTKDRICLFGEIVDGEMRLSDSGEIVAWTWQDLPNHVSNLQLDAFVVMPNHVHGIIIITNPVVRADSVGAGSEPAPTRSHGLPEIVRQFKTFAARRINDIRGAPGAPVWQRNYYEHIIRNEKELATMREYITHNPLQWETDRENREPQVIGMPSPPKEGTWFI
jgi:putative transposase